MNALGLVEPDDRLGQRVVAGVADAADGGLGAALRQPLDTDRPQRCLTYCPGADEPDRRKGVERWPLLTATCATSRRISAVDQGCVKSF